MWKGTGGGRLGEKGRGRWEKRGWEVGFPRWWETGEIGGNYAALHDISQSKKCKEAGANKYRTGTGIKGYRKQKV